MSNKRIQIFGEVLFDHFPDGSVVLGGAPFNVAWHLQAFNQHPCFISSIGQDAEGVAVQKAMEDWQMDLSGLQHDTEHPTGAVQVVFDHGEPDYDIVSAQAYDFIVAERLPAGCESGLLYHGTLALRDSVSRYALELLKGQHRGGVFMDVNLRAPWWEKDDVLALMDGADWVKLNQAELRLLHPDLDDVESGMLRCIETHDLQGLVVTLGEKGAIAVSATGERASVQPVKAQLLVDTVGAGDAFASVLMLGIHLNWPLQQTLQRAQAFASGIVGRRGATVQDSGFYAPFVEEWAL
jgi:fructokinase